MLHARSPGCASEARCSARWSVPAAWCVGRPAYLARPRPHSLRTHTASGMLRSQPASPHCAARHSASRRGTAHTCPRQQRIDVRNFQLQVAKLQLTISEAAGCAMPWVSGHIVLRQHGASGAGQARKAASTAPPRSPPPVSPRSPFFFLFGSPLPFPRLRWSGLASVPSRTCHARGRGRMRTVPRSLPTPRCMALSPVAPDVELLELQVSHQRPQRPAQREGVHALEEVLGSAKHHARHGGGRRGRGAGGAASFFASATLSEA